MVSTHSRPKAAGRYQQKFIVQELVSTHSRPKAAGVSRRIAMLFYNGFNTQPPKGGWFVFKREINLFNRVSTHSRPKAAGRIYNLSSIFSDCFNTQPPEGGWRT